MNGIAFLKMHGLGNDFVIIDARDHDIPLSPDAIRLIADRRLGVGCDQFIRMEPSQNGDVFMRIWNPDGSAAEACGNATRCVARLVMDETGREKVDVETVAGILASRQNGSGHVTVDMGGARLGWREIPLAQEADTTSVDLGREAPVRAVCVNIGNPHAVLFVPDCDAIDLATTGAALENSAMLPERANISFCTVEAPNKIRARVWERSAGATLACGSAACAIAVAGVRAGLTERSVTVALPGGNLDLEWRDDGHVLMAGPTALAYAGTLAPELAACDA
ncbi:MAG: diaminopimelate epimerase [Alphaproteobacteria bacterium]|jgi:diaminopimelate epimerase|nr:diaminopimelate epimerase [Rhodospirillaceae bacterium]MBT6203260.1 diaminopimelate epimerase [Rhodospirillaceae bacterium]MBT6511889.1 diaminopimelate epimerase [Rhodospirillaceae bacterium]MBT7612614.1 diaminopimelate epimerase [Rhodospirillaceae bacterium]MDG2481023.1 diaminopimelate epimerase [Alphaproteobacteria bacterium]